MTERLYYRDSYLTQFNARVMHITEREGKFAVVLDRTAFYPTSGGQLFDTGTLGAENILDVVEDNGEVEHILDHQPDFQVNDSVEGIIDWTRRRDNMQKHTGQHILSQAFIRVCGAETVSARLGEEDSTIDLDRDSIVADDIEKAEDLANQVIFENRPVNIEFVNYDRLKEMPLRKIPQRKEGEFRIVSIEAFDWSACGRSHCRQTGSVGIIKITGSEKIRGNLRLHFLTGLVALHDYRWRHDQIEAISNLFTRHGREALDAVRNLADENKQLRYQVTELKKELLPIKANEWYAGAVEIEGQKIIALDLSDNDFKDARDTVMAIINQYEVLVLAMVTDKLLIGASPGISYSAAEILKKVMGKIGGKGGGSVQFAQGGAFEIGGLKSLISHPESIFKM